MNCQVAIINVKLKHYINKCQHNILNMLMMSNKGIVFFFVFLYIKDIWFGEKISSLSQLLTKVR